MQLKPSLHSAFILLTLAFLLSGCNAIGAAAYKLHGPSAVEAKYKPLNEPMLVLVENYRDRSGDDMDGDMLARFLIDHLQEHKVAPLIEFDTLATLRMEPGRDFRKMNITEVGKAVGARQVLYIDLVQSQLMSPMAGETFIGRASANVKVVDVATGQTRWPMDMNEGLPIAFQTRAIAAEKGGNDPMRVRQQLHQGLAGRIGRLFYKWTPDNLMEEEMSN